MMRLAPRHVQRAVRGSPSRPPAAGGTVALGIETKPTLRPVDGHLSRAPEPSGVELATSAVGWLFAWLSAFQLARRRIASASGVPGRGVDGEHLAGNSVDVEGLVGQRDLADEGMPKGLRAGSLGSYIVGRSPSTWASLELAGLDGTLRLQRRSTAAISLRSPPVSSTSSSRLVHGGWTSRPSSLHDSSASLTELGVATVGRSGPESSMNSHGTAPR
jgi:hypothetical protein